MPFPPWTLTAWTNQWAPFPYGFRLRLSNGEPSVGGSEAEKREDWLGSETAHLRSDSGHVCVFSRRTQLLRTLYSLSPCSRNLFPLTPTQDSTAQRLVAFFTSPTPLLIFSPSNTPQITHNILTALFPVGIPTDKLIFSIVEEDMCEGRSGNWDTS